MAGHVEPELTSVPGQSVMELALPALKFVPVTLIEQVVGEQVFGEALVTVGTPAVTVRRIELDTTEPQVAVTS